MKINVIYNEECLQGMSRRIPDDSIDMILADLPYGTTQNNWDSVLPLDRVWEQYERVIKDSGAIVLTSQQPFTSKLISSNFELYRYNWIWQKNKATGFLNAKKMPLKSYEDICVFYKNLPTYNPQGLVEKEEPTINPGDRGNKERGAGGTNYGKATEDATQKYTNYPKDIIKFNVVMEPEHPTQKPVDLFKYLIKTYTDKGNIVLDNVIGSGTTAVAAKALDRKYIGFEKNKEYYEIAQERVSEVQKELIG